MSDRLDAGRGDAGTGQGGGDDDDDEGDPDDDDEEPSPLRNARFTSAPTTYALVNERYVYRPRSNGVALADFALVEPPAGMVVRRGQIEWTPTPEQGRAEPHRVTLRGRDGARWVEQSFNLKVASSAPQSARLVARESGGMVSVDRGELTGVGINVARGGLASNQTLSISQLSAAPTIPNMVGRSRAVRFGPSGTVFSSPATIMLPLPEAAGPTPVTPENVAAFVWNTEGRWQRVQVLAIDTPNRVMIARARHFSIYVAAQSRLTLTTRLARSGTGSACEGGSSAYAELGQDLETATISSVNNLPEALVPPGDPNLTPVTALLAASFEGSLRVVHVFELVEPHDGAELARDQRMLTTTAYFPGDGTATITHADALGSVLGSKSYANVVAEIDDIRARLRGTPLAGHFRTAPSDALAIAARVHLLYFEGDASRDPVDVDALGLAAAERGPVGPADGEIVDDADCDGLRDGFDETDDRAHARIEAEPSAARTLVAGETLRLRGRLVDGDADAVPDWSVIGPAGTGDEVLAAAQGAPAEVDFAATQPGPYAVTVRYVSGASVVEKVFAIDVLEPVPTSGDDPPTCTPSKPTEQARAGVPIALAATVADGETPASGLRVRWGVVSNGQPATLSDDAALRGQGSVAVLTAPAGGASIYTVGCRASDGTQEGPIGVVSIPVVSASTNRPPEALTVTPALSEVPVGGTWTFRAYARDPDGDALSYQWQVGGGLALEGDPGDDDAGTRRRVRALRAGMGQVTVTVSDGTTSVPLTLAIQVRSDVDAGTSTTADAGVMGEVDAGPSADAGTTAAVAQPLDAGMDAQASQ